MPNQIYALQQDMDIVNNDIQELKRAFHLLDYIAKITHDCELEQLAQGAQMRRIETRLDNIETRVGKLEERMQKLEERMEKMEDQLKLVIKQLDAMGKQLGAVINRLDAIENHLGIKT